MLVSVGAGIHVSRAVSSNTGTSYGLQGPQPNNSFVVVDTEYSASDKSVRLWMYCCSNSSSPRNGSFTFPNGYTTSSNYGNANIFKYSRSLSGCYNLNYNNDSYFSLSHSGVYTCSIDDSNGNNIDVHIGLYEEGFNSKHNGS